MDVDKIPVVGKINRSLTNLMVNFVILAVVSLILGAIIPFFPRVLDILVGAFLIVGGLIFLNIAWNVHKVKKKYIDWMKG